MLGRRPGCDRCLIRNVLFADQIKGGVVNQRAFKDKDPDGLSLTETRDQIIGLDDLDEYIDVVSPPGEHTLGVAVMEADEARGVGLTWHSDPHRDHKFGHLHVLGPTPDKMTEELRKECARLANLTGWSRSPAG